MQAQITLKINTNSEQVTIGHYPTEENMDFLSKNLCTNKTQSMQTFLYKELYKYIIMVKENRFMTKGIAVCIIVLFIAISYLPCISTRETQALTTMDTNTNITNGEGDGTLSPDLPTCELSHDFIEMATSPLQESSALSQETTFNLIGTLDVCNGGTVASYDTNHNGFVELIYERKESGVFPAIFYENIDGKFTLVHTLGVYGPVWDAGDFDGDGKGDIITQHIDEIRIYESSDENTYPSSLIWSAQLSGNIVCFATGGFDLDKDDRQEIIVANNFGYDTHTNRVYENNGDNTYTLVFETSAIAGHQVGIVADDFDSDGKMEFLASNEAPEVIIYENNGDNSYQEECRINYSYYNAGQGCLGDDTDNDGSNEIILAGENIITCKDDITFIESSIDNNYFITSQIKGPSDNACGTRYRSIIGNVMGGPRPELIISGYREWYIYRPIANNQFQEIFLQNEPSNIDGQLFLTNTNNNEYQEIVIASNYIGSTKVYETGDVEPNDPVFFSKENPEINATNVMTTLFKLNVTIEDPEGDSFNWDIETSPDIGNSHGTNEYNGSKSCLVTGLQNNTIYTWYVNATDPAGSGTWIIAVYTFTTEKVPQSSQPDLDCQGTLSWTKVKPGTTVTGSFIVKNIGEDTSQLDWKVESWPTWGTWTFIPSNGTDLTPEHDPQIIDVTVVVPDEKNKNFTGKIKIVNKENSSDFSTISVSLTTPRSRLIIHLLFLKFFERLLERFPLLEKLLFYGFY